MSFTYSTGFCLFLIKQLQTKINEKLDVFELSRISWTPSLKLEQEKWFNYKFNYFLLIINLWYFNISIFEFIYAK